MASDIVDRKYVARYSLPTFGLQVHVNGAPAAADGPVEASLVSASTDLLTEPVWTAEAVSGDTAGTYEVSLASTVTATPGLYTLLWDYVVGGEQQVYGLDIEVGPSSPAYDALPVAWAAVIENVWVKFADLFDSPYGGPNLAVYVQSHFGRNRLAQLLPSALQRLNSASTPHQVFGLGGIDFPFADWGGLLAQSLYIEVLKHLIRSYVEQPEAVLGTAISRLDRRDYMQRWQEVLTLETAEFTLDLGRYRKSFMGLGNVSVLVAGGAYGNFGNFINPGGAGEAAARGYFYVGRFH